MALTALLRQSLMMDLQLRVETSEYVIQNKISTFPENDALHRRKRGLSDFPLSHLIHIE